MVDRVIFLASAMVVWAYVNALSKPVTDQKLVMEHDRMMATQIIVALSIFVVAIIAGYFYNKALSRKLDRLWEEKSKLF